MIGGNYPFCGNCVRECQATIKVKTTTQAAVSFGQNKDLLQNRKGAPK
jgi:hypothetical protein